MRRLSSKIKLSSEHERVLQALVIEESGLSAILHDFDVLLEYIRGRDLPLTGTHQLSLRILPEDIQKFLALT